MNKKTPQANIAILELSSRACKFMTVRTSRLRNGFNWSAFKSESTLTQIGQLLDTNNTIHWGDFEEKVFPTIQKYTQKARRDHSISKLYCVATAAYRQANNQEEIIQKLKETLELDVHLLTQKEEAELTLEAFRWSSPPPEGRTLFIDQGGCSTEISIFANDFSDVQNSALPFGTTSLMHLFFQGIQSNTPIGSALELFLDHEKELIQQLVERLFEGPLNKRKHYHYHSVVGVGSAITKVTNQRINKQQHGMILPLSALRKKRSKAQTMLEVNFKTVASLQNYLLKNKLERNSLEEEIVSFFGLGLFIELLDALKLEKIIVNGTGLRYGVCLQKLRNSHPHLNF